MTAELTGTRAVDEIDACIERAMAILRRAVRDANDRRRSAFDPLTSLYVTESEVDAILDSSTVAERDPDGARFELAALTPLALDAFAHDVVALAVAAEYVPRLDRVVGFLHDDLTRRALSCALLIQLVAHSPDERRRVRDSLAGGALERLKIVTRTEGTVPLHDSVRIDAGMLSRLRGDDGLDTRLRSFVGVLPAPPDASQGPIGTSVPLVLWGASPDGIAAAARLRAAAYGREALRASAAMDLDLLGLVLRDAALSGRVVIVECTDPVRARESVTACAHTPVPVFIEAPAGIVRYDGPAVRVTERDAPVAVAPAAYPLPYGRRIVARRGFDRVVLPAAQLRAVASVADRVAHRGTVYETWGLDRGSSSGGVRALFGGPPGTGKTLAAEALAHGLRRDLYVVDVSTVVSKYIGETEKALATVFAEAARAGVCLFFDEADALFGKRTEAKDAHDRYANIETAYLLQALDLYPDVVILATNMLGNLDDALTRRIDVMVEFPLPAAHARETLWRRAFADAPLASDVDSAALAQRFTMAGGSIQNAAIAAAVRAASESRAIGMLDVVRAARDELQKLGRVPGRSELGDAYDALRSEDAG